MDETANLDQQIAAIKDKISETDEFLCFIKTGESEISVYQHIEWVNLAKWLNLVDRVELELAYEYLGRELFGRDI